MWNVWTVTYFFLYIYTTVLVKITAFSILTQVSLTAVAQWLRQRLAPIEPGFSSHWYPVIGGSTKDMWPKLLPCTSKSPNLVGTSEPLNKRIDDINFRRYLGIASIAYWNNWWARDAVLVLITGQNQRRLQLRVNTATESAAQDEEWASHWRYEWWWKPARQSVGQRLIVWPQSTWPEIAVGCHSKATHCWQGGYLLFFLFVLLF